MINQPNWLSLTSFILWPTMTLKRAKVYSLCVDHEKTVCKMMPHKYLKSSELKEKSRLMTVSKQFCPVITLICFSDSSCVLQASGRAPAAAACLVRRTPPQIRSVEQTPSLEARAFLLHSSQGQPWNSTWVTAIRHRKYANIHSNSHQTIRQKICFDKNESLF